MHRGQVYDEPAWFLEGPLLAMEAADLPSYERRRKLRDFWRCRRRLECCPHLTGRGRTWLTARCSWQAGVYKLRVGVTLSWIASFRSRLGRRSKDIKMNTVPVACPMNKVDIPAILRPNTDGPLFLNALRYLITFNRVHNNVQLQVICQRSDVMLVGPTLYAFCLRIHIYTYIFI
jgi:hypothetical protein